MKYYIEIIFKDKIQYNNLWSNVYNDLHLALVNNKSADGFVNYGFSFPEYYFDSINNLGLIGGKIRIFAETLNELEKLNLYSYLSRWIYFINLSCILRVPDNITGHSIYRRVQFKSSNERLARRYAKRHNIKYEESLEIYSDKSFKLINLPFISMKSLTNGNNFNLFICKLKVDKPSNCKKFNTYGLGINSSVPEF